MTTLETPDASTLAHRFSGKSPFKTLAPIVGSLGVAHLPLLIVYATVLWARPHYQFFPFVLIGAGALAHARLQGTGPFRAGGLPISLGLAGLAWSLLALATILYFPWMGTVAALITLLAIIYGLGGGPLVVVLLPAWAFLWTAAPPPLGFDTALIARLQLLVSRITDPVLDLFGVSHYMLGNVVIIPGRKLMIKEACSGIQSLLPVICSTIFYVLWTKPSVLRSLTLIATSLFWVVLGNVARVIAVVVLAGSWNIDATEGWLHEGLGILTFCMILLLIWSSDRLIQLSAVLTKQWALRSVSWVRSQLRKSRSNPLRSYRSRKSKSAPVEESVVAEATALAETSESTDADVDSDASTVPLPGPLPSLPDPRSTWLRIWPVLGLFGLLGAVQIAFDGRFIREDLFGRSQFVSACSSLKKETLPAALGAFRLRDFEILERDSDDFQGEFSRIWRYEWRGRRAFVSVDYPFVGWHELPVCYRGEGWSLDRPTLRQAAGPDGAPAGPVIEAHMHKPKNEFGTLFFSICNKGGGYLGAGPVGHDYNLTRRLQEKLFGGLSPFFGGGTRTSYQFQMVVRGGPPLSPDEENEARAFFDALRAVVRRAGPGGDGGVH